MCNKIPEKIQQCSQLSNELSVLICIIYVVTLESTPPTNEKHAYGHTNIGRNWGSLNYTASTSPPPHKTQSRARTRLVVGALQYLKQGHSLRRACLQPALHMSTLLI